MMKMITLTALAASLVFLLANACIPPATPSTSSQLANPAATFCIEQGHRYEIRSEESGDQYGVCLFAAGAECDAWAYFRGECTPDGQSADMQVESINLVQSANLGHTTRIDVIVPRGLSADPEVPPSTRIGGRLTINSIVDPQTIAALLRLLDAPLPLQPRSDCSTYYSLRFIDREGSTQTFGYDCSPKSSGFVRSSSGVLAGHDVVLPAKARALLAPYLKP